MKQLVYVILLLALNLGLQTLNCVAQQNALFSQYMFNGLLINPAYAGSSNSTMGSLTYKNKFLGIAGAPQTNGFSIHTAMQDESMGVGLSIMNNRKGVTNQLAATAVYAYHLKLATGKLSFAEGRECIPLPVTSTNPQCNRRRGQTPPPQS